MGAERIRFQLKAKAELLKNLAERYPDFDSGASELRGRITAAANLLESAREEILDSHQLSHGRLLVLVFLLSQELMRRASASPSGIAEALGVTPATVTGLLDGLEREAYVERHPDKNDRRALAITLTDKSRKFLDDYMPEQSRQLNSCLRNLDPGERQTLAALLGKVTDPSGAAESEC